VRFHFFRQHAAARRAVALDQSGLFFSSRAFEIYSDNVSQRGHCLSWIVAHVVVERDGVACNLQALAGCDYQIVRFHVLQDLDHRLAGREQSDVVLEQQIARAVDEGPLPVAQDIEPHQQSAIERTACCGLGVGCAEEILDSVPKQKFIAKHLLLTVQNRLARNKSEELFRSAGDGFQTW
jgi:hypothetical protein